MTLSGSDHKSTRTPAVAECGDGRPLFQSGTPGRCAANGTVTLPRLG